MTIDFAPVLQAVVGVVALAALHYGRKLINVFADKIGIEKDDRVRAYLNEAAFNAIEYGYRVAFDTASEHAPKLDVRNQALAVAADYMRDRVPDGLRHFGLDRDGVLKLLEARAPADGVTKVRSTVSAS